MDRRANMHKAFRVLLGAFAALHAARGAESADLPKSLFVSPSGLSNVPDAEIRQWFDHIAAHHRAPNSPRRIDCLVLSDVADADPADPGHAGTRIFATPPPDANPLHYHPSNRKLDVISKYFGTFDAVYVGTVHVPWQGPGNAYDTGIKDHAFRLGNLRLSTNAMDRFAATYPRLEFRWYVSYEANLNHFTDPEIKNSYVAYNTGLCREMLARRKTDILWSPNFWSRHDAVPDEARAILAANLRDHFARVPITEVHFQDFLGGSSASDPHRLTVDDAKHHYDLLAGLGGPKIRVNAEMFIVTDLKKFSLAPMRHADYVQRMRDYARLGLPLGASWEIRYWWAAHQ